LAYYNESSETGLLTSTVPLNRIDSKL